MILDGMFIISIESAGIFEQIVQTGKQCKKIHYGINSGFRLFICMCKRLIYRVSCIEVFIDNVFFYLNGMKIM